jgi:deoxyribodipyrimidine photolyase
VADLKLLPNLANYGVVWFKRDQRSVDHAALCAAAQRGRMLCLYIFEASLWVAPDAANQHYQLILERLRILEIDANGPDVLRLEGRFLTDEFAFVPGFAIVDGFHLRLLGC